VLVAATSKPAEKGKAPDVERLVRNAWNVDRWGGRINRNPAGETYDGGLWTLFIFLFFLTSPSISSGRLAKSSDCVVRFFSWTVSFYVDTYPKFGVAARHMHKSCVVLILAPILCDQPELGTSLSL